MPPTPARIICDSRAIVGESPVWDERPECLLWVNIVGKQIHRLHPATGKLETWATPDFVTAVGLRDDGGAIVSLTKDICRWNFGGPFEAFVRTETQSWA